MVAYWPGGTRPWNTNVSVPRLTPERRVRTTTSSGPGSGSVTGRISPQPGARSQNACAISGPLLVRFAHQSPPDTVRTTPCGRARFFADAVPGGIGARRLRRHDDGSPHEAGFGHQKIGRV